MKAVYTIGQFALLLPLSIGAIRLRKMPHAGRWIIALLVVWLAAEVMQYITRQQQMNNMWVATALVPLQAIVLAGFYRSISVLPKVVIILFIFGLLLCAAEAIYRPLTELNSWSLIYECALISAVGLYIFYTLAEKYASAGKVWLNGSIMFMFMGSGVYYAAFLLKSDMELLITAAGVHSVLLILCYLGLTIGLWKL